MRRTHLTEPARLRNPDVERQQRESYLLLAHLFSVSGGDGSVPLAELDLARDLAFDQRTVLRGIEHLTTTGYLRWNAHGELFVTSRGVAYVATEAGHRQSIRDALPELGAPTLTRWRDPKGRFARR
jgi:hypothetical protein